CAKYGDGSNYFDSW
nr:immunoglobulin heavy chain junction region [Macaca mulatta]MOW91551.1 immunoglobulin heavy chain junction region [Macaca mulatta]MOW92883.1 immunoglobulin heavy chain junction region [Macaca mulatta]